jgi:hypothetical protein
MLLRCERLEPQLGQNRKSSMRAYDFRFTPNQNKRAAEEISGPPAQSGQRRLVKVLCYFSL